MLHKDRAVLTKMRSLHYLTCSVRTARDLLPVPILLVWHRIIQKVSLVSSPIPLRMQCSQVCRNGMR